MTDGRQTAAPKLKLPRVESVRLQRFSLFPANPNAEFVAGAGVLCLIGANGIGKSTLLSAINFCLTGTVPDPSRAFVSMDEYYRHTRTYSGTYFRGRIVGGDEDDAEVGLSFRLGDFKYDVRRGLFEPEALRELVIRRCHGSTDDVLTDGVDLPRSKRHQHYATSLVEHSGLTSFEEFVFLQHFVFTFDEQRRTLFWNSRIMERVLYRAFGLDPTMATSVDALRREIQHQDSRVRNRQWESTRMRKRINTMQRQHQELSSAQEKYDALSEDHEGLTGKFDEESTALRDTEKALEDANLRLAGLSARASALRDEYASVFRDQFTPRTGLVRHPWIAQSIVAKSCGLCGTPGDEVTTALGSLAEAHMCPLCRSPLSIEPEMEIDPGRLMALDEELGAVEKDVRDVSKSIQTLRDAAHQARSTWEATKQRLEEFEVANSTTMISLRELLNSGADSMSLAAYRDQLAVVEKEKNDAYNERERLNMRLEHLRKALQSQYLGVEEAFVPRFSALAQRFLGMSLSVQLEASKSHDARLVVNVRGTTRRKQHNLSESQRFFLDIALRMALTQHMSDAQSLGPMFIDTPEGSLDIAYEKRAGDMLSDFVQSGHQLIMTANVNSSKLLLELARRCGRSQMRLCRMTDWAELSEVQTEEEGLFAEAYSQIEAAFGPC